MSTYKEGRIAQAETLIEMQREKIARLLALPDEPVQNDNDPLVIWFERNYGGKVTFTFAAVKAGDGLWYMTGRENAGRTWDDLLSWFGDEDVTVLRATQWEVAQ